MIDLLWLIFVWAILIGFSCALALIGAFLAIPVIAGLWRWTSAWF